MKLALTFLLLTAPFASLSQTTAEHARRAFAFLLGAQDTSGQFSDSLNPLFDVWETVLVTDALLDTLPETDPVVRRALDWLETHRNGQGLICHNAACSESYCVETSALYLRVLARTSRKETGPVVALARMQEENGSWKVGNPDVTDRVAFPSVTAFAINLFRATGQSGWNAPAARRYLLSQQLPDGSFGKAWEYYNCSGYALWQCMPVLKTNSADSGAFASAKAFVLSQQLTDGSWNEADSSVNRISPELQTVFMLHCLKNETDPASAEAFRKGLSFLLSRQLPNGSWDGGYFPIPKATYKKREYLITTALAYKLLTGHPKHPSSHD